jgi:uroporphyrinogen-III decarboxylase
MGSITSRQRLLDALNLRTTDHIPCCFMSFTALRQHYHDDWYAVALAEKAMGLDPMLFIPSAPRRERREHPELRGLPVRFDPSVKTLEWREGDVLHKEYHTPAGKLSTSVRLSDDWPHGDHIPFMDDYQIPRAIQHLVKGMEDLPALQYLLTPPSAADREAFAQEVSQARGFVEQHGILLTGGWGVGMDMANWLCGMQPLMMHVLEQPDFVSHLLEMIHAWNMQRMRVVLSAPVDLYIRRSWYEGCDFITPRFYRRVVLPHIQTEAALAHEHGAKFGYICTSGTKPLLNDFIDAGIDVLIGMDPIQGTYTDLPLMKSKLGGRVCLWGGVSGAVTVEQGSEEDVRAAVRQAITVLGPQGFILCPVDNITVDTPQTWRNIDIFIDEWRKSSTSL